jgi:pimeloyl-ACP methyl ester carboxylesterase
MRVETCGVGEPVVLIHGWASHGRVFDSVVADLSTDHQCHVVDLPGHGTAASGHWEVSFDDMVDAVATHVRSLETPPRLLGWAMGAMISLSVATRIDTRELVCVGTASGGEGFEEVFTKMADRMSPDWPRFARSSVDTIVGDRVSPEMHAFLVQMMASTPLAVARRTLVEVGRRDPEQWAADVDTPILFVHGSEDQISPAKVSKRLAAAAANATLRIYEGSGHAPHLEDPARFIADVRSFWGGKPGE